MTRVSLRRLALLILIGSLACCDAAKKKKKKKAAPTTTAVKREFRLTSPGWGNGGEFPTDNRGDEDNVSPALEWSGAPKNTETFVLIVESETPGAEGSAARGRETHWIVYDIPKEVTIYIRVIPL